MLYTIAKNDRSRLISILVKHVRINKNALAICTLNWTSNRRDLDGIRSAVARVDSTEMMNLWEKSHHIILMGIAGAIHIERRWRSFSTGQLVRGKTAGGVSFVFLLIVHNTVCIISYELFANDSR